MGFSVQGVGCRFQGLWCVVYFSAYLAAVRLPLLCLIQQLLQPRPVDAPNLVYALGFRVSGLGFRVQGLGVGIWGLWFRFWGLGLRVYG